MSELTSCQSNRFVDSQAPAMFLLHLHRVGMVIKLVNTAVDKIYLDFNNAMNLWMEVSYFVVYLPPMLPPKYVAQHWQPFPEFCFLHTSLRPANAAWDWGFPIDFPGLRVPHCVPRIGVSPLCSQDRNFPIVCCVCRIRT